MSVEPASGPEAASRLTLQPTYRLRASCKAARRQGASEDDARLYGRFEAGARPASHLNTGVHMRLSSQLKCVGKNIREARRKAGLRQIDIETRAGITYRHYQNIEAGKINVGITTLLKLAEAFGATVEELLSGC
jgi:DNA-binding XRE family transcriptional regulator